MKKILFFINDLGGGGAARKVSIIANALAEKGHEVSLATNFEIQSAYQLNSAISIYQLYPPDSYGYGRLRRICYEIINARRIVKSCSPDVIVTSITFITVIVRIAIMGLHIPLVVSDETSYARKTSAFDYFVRNYFYNFTSAVVLLSNNDMKILGKRLPQKIVIYNPISIPEYLEDIPRDKIVLVIGHTDRWEVKGLDLAIISWSKIASANPRWSLFIVGGSNDESLSYLRNLSIEYGVERSVNFGPFCRDMPSLMRKCSVLAMTSRFEGFSLGLIEALSVKLPVVAFDCQGVISEVSSNGAGTLIVKDGDIDGFAEKLNLLLNNPELRDKLGAQGRKMIFRYSVDVIVEQWDKLFEKVCQKTNIYA